MDDLCYDLIDRVENGVLIYYAKAIGLYLIRGVPLPRKTSGENVRMSYVGLIAREEFLDLNTEAIHLSSQNHIFTPVPVS